LLSAIALYRSRTVAPSVTAGASSPSSGDAVTFHDDSRELDDDPVAKIHRWVAIVMFVILSIEMGVALWEAQWLNAVLIATIAVLILSPTLLGDHLSVKIPYEFQLTTQLFVFAALFLGEVRSYYERFWWWDIVLHTASGLLLGVFGFLLVYVLNESRRLDISMRPRFVALFAFLFAVAGGAIWEIFEFSMDQVFATQMQKPMLGDPSGLTDTMWDLIVDTGGALTVAMLGWRRMRSKRPSFIDSWIRKFIASNPSMFR
jgi:uncharacterized membrane protein YjdF